LIMLFTFFSLVGEIMATAADDLEIIMNWITGKFRRFYYRPVYGCSYLTCQFRLLALTKLRSSSSGKTSSNLRVTKLLKNWDTSTMPGWMWPLKSTIGAPMMWLEWHRGIDFLPAPERMRISIQLSW